LSGVETDAVMNQAPILPSMFAFSLYPNCDQVDRYSSGRIAA
jgi:hypothetical protein